MKIHPSPCIDIHRDTIARSGHWGGTLIGHAGWPGDWYVHPQIPAGYLSVRRTISAESERRIKQPPKVEPPAPRR